MKMNQNHNLFSFLSRGVTTTHPWCSVFILLICFVFCANNVSVFASQSNIPEMTDWQFSQALDAYAGLTDDQKDIANFLVGSQGYAFAGIAQSNLNSSFSSYSDTVEYVKNFGAKMWDEFNTHVDGVVQSGRNNLLAVKNDLSNFFGNCASYAKSRSESFSAWLGNVGIDYNSSSEFRIQFGKDQAQNNIDYFGDQGLYNWQFSEDVLSPNGFAFTWRYTTGSKPSAYYNYLNSMGTPKVKLNRINFPSVTDSYLSSSFFNTYNIIFLNLSTYKCYLVSSSGQHAPSNFYCFMCGMNSGSFISNNSFVMSCNELSTENFATVYDLYLYLSSYSGALFVENWSGANYENNPICLADFVTDLRVGYTFEASVPWTRDFDLNLSSTSQYVTVNAPTNVIYLDLNGFMRDLYDNPTIIYNYVINNSIDGNGDPVDPSGFEPVSKFPGLPDSGITIGTEFFKINGLNPIFGSGGYIDALWNNTKGLVLYIGDILKVLTLDSIDGGGFAWVIYGAVSMGIIGGIFSKFLL